MTKSNIIRFLQKLSPYSIKSLDIVYHKMTCSGSYYYLYNYSSNSEFFSTPLVEVLLSLYRLRGYVRVLNLVYFDKQGQMQQLNYKVKDFVGCATLSDFINSKS